MKYFGLFFLVGFMLAAAFPVSAQESTQGSPAIEVPPPPASGTADKKPDIPEAYDINYSYDPGTRRDPFISLVAGVKGKTPKGALTVNDAKVVGITRSRDGFVAIIVGADNKSRFMKVGDKLYDGEIIAIGADSVTFRQDLTEDTMAAPGLKSKEVIKRLHPVQEGT
jgi:hypothetical protein